VLGDSRDSHQVVVAGTTHCTKLGFIGG